MSDICCGIRVPPVPERPIDVTQPAYVLVDGHWVLLSDVISEYLPPAAPGKVLQVKRTTLPNFSSGNINDPARVGSAFVVTPRSPDSHLLAFASANLNVSLSPPASFSFGVDMGFRYETATGVVDTSTWNTFGARDSHTVTDSDRNAVTFQRAFTQTQRRTDDGNWAVGVWYLMVTGSAAILSFSGTAQVTFIEYLPD